VAEQLFLLLKSKLQNNVNKVHFLLGLRGLAEYECDTQAYAAGKDSYL
jgi:hypothetical protein